MLLVHLLTKVLPLFVTLIIYFYSYIAEGGNCNGYIDKIYGDAKMIPSPNPSTINKQVGSSGKAGSSETRGGGRIVLYFDNIYLQGGSLSKLTANGAAISSSPANGGTGGYIYVKTFN